MLCDVTRQGAMFGLLPGRSSLYIEIEGTDLATRIGNNNFLITSMVEARMVSGVLSSRSTQRVGARLPELLLGQYRFISGWQGREVLACITPRSTPAVSDYAVQLGLEAFAGPVNGGSLSSLRTVGVLAAARSDRWASSTQRCRSRYVQGRFASCG
jgi:hypothetical protein